MLTNRPCHGLRMSLVRFRDCLTLPILHKLTWMSQVGSNIYFRSEALRFYVSNVIFAMNGAHNYHKTLKCIFEILRCTTIRLKQKVSISYTTLQIMTGFPQGLENLEKSNFLEKSWEVMELWKIIKSRGKIMELRKSHTDKSSPALEIWHW